MPAPPVRRRPAIVDAAMQIWDGEPRGLERPPGMNDSLWVVRQAALQDHNFFMGLIWKDRKGQRVKNAEVHRAMSTFLDAARAAGIPALVLAPMGIGKSEQGQGYTLGMLSRDPYLRGGIVTDKDDHSAQRVSLIRRYIRTDKDYRRLFPDIRVSKTPDTRLAFRLNYNQHAKDESMEGSGILSSGTGTRKDFLFFDDCVTAKNAITEPASRVRVIAAYEQTWIGRLIPGAWHYCIATLYHSADLWHRLMEKQQDNVFAYAVLRIGVSADFKQYDVEERWPTGKTKQYSLPLWEGVWDEAAYRTKYSELIFEGDATAWYTGYRNMVIDPLNTTFRKQDFFLHSASNARAWYPYVVLYADPASTTADEADNFAGWVLAYDPFHKAAVVLDGWYKRRIGLTERVNTFLDMYEKWQPTIAAVEGRHEVSFAQRIEEMAVERGLSFRLRKVTQTNAKDVRVGGLAPLMERGKIRVDCNRFPWLWVEAAVFPKGRYDDALDALEGAWALLRGALRAAGAMPGTFNLDAQYLQDLGHVPSTDPEYRIPGLPEGDSPSRWGKIENILFPGTR